MSKTCCSNAASISATGRYGIGGTGSAHCLPATFAAGDLAIQWLSKTPVGVDLSTVAGKAILTMLEHPLVRMATQRDLSADTARTAVIAMHCSVLDGGAASRHDWRTARRAAMDVTDTVNDDLVHAAAAMVEVSAWPHTLRTTLYDTLSALSALAHRKAQADIGWSDMEEKAVFATFDKISQKAGSTEPLVGDDLLHRLARLDPVMATRFAERCAASTKAQGVYAEVGDAILCDISLLNPVTSS